MIIYNIPTLDQFVNRFRNFRTLCINEDKLGITIKIMKESKEEHVFHPLVLCIWTEEREFAFSFSEIPGLPEL